MVVASRVRSLPAFRSEDVSTEIRLSLSMSSTIMAAPIPIVSTSPFDASPRAMFEWIKERSDFTSRLPAAASCEPLNVTPKLLSTLLNVVAPPALKRASLYSSGVAPPSFNLVRTGMSCEETPKRRMKVPLKRSPLGLLYRFCTDSRSATRSWSKEALCNVLSVVDTMFLVERFSAPETLTERSPFFDSTMLS